MNIPEWFDDPRVQHISSEKLSLLLSLAKQVEGKTQKEMMPIMLGAVAAANKRNLHFTQEEFSLIFEIMKEGKSEEEKQQMDNILEKARKAMPKK